MFTSGYDFYAPTENVLYHLYSRAHRPTFQEVQPPDKEVKKAESQCSVRGLLGMCGESDSSSARLVDEKYGLGSRRSLLEFQESLGVNFAQRRVDENHDWNSYINSCHGTDKEEITIKYQFVESEASNGLPARLIEEIGGDCIDKKAVGSQLKPLQPIQMSDMLKALAGLDRVQEFLGADK